MRTYTEARKASLHYRRCFFVVYHSCGDREVQQGQYSSMRLLSVNSERRSGGAQRSSRFSFGVGLSSQMAPAKSSELQKKGQFAQNRCAVSRPACSSQEHLGTLDHRSCLSEISPQNLIATMSDLETLTTNTILTKLQQHRPLWYSSISEMFGQPISDFCKKHNVDVSSLDLIANDGQTIWLLSVPN